MERTWLLTWTTYGTWLPGDRRGSVCRLLRHDGRRRYRNQAGAFHDFSEPALNEHCKDLLKCDPVYLTLSQAISLHLQFLETARFRGHRLDAGAIMTNHVHLLATVSGNPDPESLLRDFKSYGSRRLNRLPDPSPKWWTESGSKRKIQTPDRAIAYVLEQPFPLLRFQGENILLKSEGE